MTTNKRQHRRRDRLFRQNPFCHWCGVLLSHPQEYGTWDKHGIFRLKRPAYHMMTLDHLDSRLNPNRGSFYGVPGKPRTVLACKECNEYRSRLEEAAIPVQELHRRAANSGSGRMAYYSKYGEYPEETRPALIPQEYRPS